MSDGFSIRVPLFSSVLVALSLAPACGGDSGSDGGDGSFTTAEETSTTAGDGDGDAEGAEAGDGDGDPATGDGDGDSGDGDGDSGDGDGDPTTTGDGDGDSGDGDGEPGDGDGDIACQEFAGEIAPIPPSVMFLLDRSGSMLEVGFDPNNPDKTRWNVLYEAVEAVVDEGADAQIAFGAKTFSTQGFGACGVSNTPDVPIAINNANNLLDGIPGPLAQVNGGTPTNLALETTMSIMELYDAGDSDKFIFLITDGRIGCLDGNNPNADDEALADAVAVLEDGFMNHDITTYVVGIAPSIFGPIIPQLEGMAIAGGAPKQGLEPFYRADDAQQLADALAQVVEDSYGKSCLLDLMDPPFFPEFTKVVVGNNVYELVNDCATEDGFVYTKDDFSQIELCGTACEELAIEQSAEVQFFCNPG